MPKQAVEGLRITDAATLDAVIAVLAGTVNTRLVAALVAARRARGRPDRRGRPGRPLERGAAAPHRGRAARRPRPRRPAGSPSATPTLIADLVRHGYVPAIACLGVTMPRARC